jgi:hypothetical protein
MDTSSTRTICSFSRVHCSFELPGVNRGNPQLYRCGLLISAALSNVRGLARLASILVKFQPDVGQRD